MNLQRYVSPGSDGFMFLLFFAMICSLAMGFADVYDHMSNVDVITYVGLSEFDLDQHPVRRYRIIIPFLAAGVHYVFGHVFSMLSPNDFPGDFSRIMSFVVVNSALMAFYFLLVFKICKSILGRHAFWPALIGVISILTCRWTLVLSGSALVDSLYLVVLGLLLLGILEKKMWMLILAIYLGPWAKEAFIFLVPLLIFVDRKHYIQLAVHLVISGILIFLFRYGFDQMIGAQFGESIARDVSHFEVIPQSLGRLFSFHGLYEVFSIGGAWNLLIAIGLFWKGYKDSLLSTITPMWYLLVVLVLIQALLSFELARMFYLLTTLLAVVVALLFNVEQWKAVQSTK